MSKNAKSHLRAMWQTLRLAVGKFSRIDGAQRGAAFGYYAFFALFPLLVLFVTVGSLFVDRDVAVQQVMNHARLYFPLEPEMERNVVKTIVGVIETRGQVGTIAFVGLIWASLQLFKALVRATSYAWESPMHNWWQMPLKALALLLVLGSALILGLGVPAAINFISAWLPQANGIIETLVTLAVALVPTLVLFYGLTLFYRLAPRRATRFEEVWLSAAVAALLLRGLELLFLLYLTRFGRFNVLYGTLGGIMALLMWIYLSGCVVIFGACLSSALAERRERATGA
jgi:YihY family inner membrane protein